MPEGEPQDRHARRPSALRKAMLWTVTVATVALALCIGAGYLGRLHPWLEVFAHFMHLYLPVSLLLLVTLAALRTWRAACVALALAAATGYEVAPFYLAHPTAAAANHQELVLITANVEWPVRNAERVVAWVESERPDLFVAQELTEKWCDALEQLHTLYPFRLEDYHGQFHGTALLSRSPLQRLDPPEAHDLPRRSIAARVDAPGGPFVLVVVHATQATPLGSRVRTAQLQTLGRWLQDMPRPVIVAGDLNCTPWSPIYDDLAGPADLRNARYGFGVLPTFPLGGCGPVVPIDHVLVTPDIAVLDCRSGPDIGSDHLPLRVRLGPTPAGPR